MSATLTERSTAPASPPPPVARGGSRMQRWLNSWRVSLKMARRDALRYKGRSALVILMVALPVALIVGGLTLSATSFTSAAEALPRTLGSAVARVDTIQTTVVQQGVDGSNSYQVSGPSPEDQPAKAKPIPGVDPETDRPSEIAAALGVFLGGTVKAVESGDFRWHDGDRRPWGDATFFDMKQDFGERAKLTDGRWPTDNSEVVVTPRAVHEGLPTSGTITLTVGGEARVVTIVGQADVASAWGGMTMLATTKPWVSEGPSGPASASYLLFRDAPFTWSEVRNANEHGLSITSREVILNPPAASELPADIYQQDVENAKSLRIAAAMLGATLFLLTALLVGPAFAVSAGRQRRSLALAASNGAETRQLRRSVLASAVVLGAIAVLIGAALGAAVALAAAAIWTRMRPWDQMFGPAEIPWLGVLIVVVCAVLAALFAALIPALKLGRLDIVGVMKGQNVSPPIDRKLPIVGAVLFALGVVGVFGAVVQESAVMAALGVFGLFLGPICLIPLLLVACGKLASRFSAPVRMASRDAARQRHRSAPTVAAVMAGAALLSTFAVALASDTKFQAKLYTPRNIAGEASTWVDPATMPALLASLQANAPTWRTAEQRYIAADYGTPGAEKKPTEEPFLSVQPPGCTVADTMPNYEGAPSPETEKCAVAGTNGGMSMRAGVMVTPAAEIIRRVGATGAQAQAIRDGAVLVGDPAWTSGGKVTLAYGGQPIPTDANPTGPAQPTWSKSTAYPAIVIDEATYRRGAVESYTGVVLTQELVEKLKLPTTMSGLYIYDPNGPISKDAEDKVNDKLGEDMRIQVERGFQRSDWKIMLIVFGIAGFLLTTVTLISTALALAEQQADMGTLAAVGATKGTRRRFAGAQAATVALVGVALGTLIGLVAGVAIAYPSTSRGWDEALQKEVTLSPTIGIPIWHLLSILIGVPLVAALVAAVSIRRAPHVTRRGN